MMNLVKAFFVQNQGTFPWILKKGRGDLPPSTPLSYVPAQEGTCVGVSFKNASGLKPC